MGWIWQLNDITHFAHDKQHFEKEIKTNLEFINNECKSVGKKPGHH